MRYRITLFILAIGLLATAAYAATSFTTHFLLAKPADGDTGWGDSYRSNMDTIDTQMYVNEQAIQDHIDDLVGAHEASAISTVPAAAICTEAETVQDYLDCLDAEIGVITGGSVVTTNTDQTITGQKTFTAAILASGGVTGDVTGNLTGNVTGNVTGNLTGNVTGDVTGNLTGNVTGNVSGTAATFTGSLTGDVTSTGMSTSIASGVIVNDDVNASAGIARSKLASGTAHGLIVNDASGIMSSLGPLTNGQILIGSTGGSAQAASITGTANQITVTGGSGSIGLSLPQDITTTSNVQFGTVLAGSSTIDASAALAANSTTKGFLPPRMSEAQRDLIGSPATGLVVFNTTTNQLNVYNGSAWGAVGGGTYVANFTGTTITATNDPTQVFRYTGGSAQVISAITVTALADGGIIEITGTSDTNTITLNHNDTAGGWILNGQWVGGQYSKIGLRLDTTANRLIEVYRNEI